MVTTGVAAGDVVAADAGRDVVADGVAAGVCG